MSRTTMMCSIIGVCLLAGCQGNGRQEKALQLAKDRFDHSKADLKYLLAADQYKNGQIKHAKQSIQEAIGLDPNAGEYYLLLAKIFIEEGSLSNADKALRTIRELSGATAEHSYVSGILAERFGRQSEALAHYEMAHEMDPLNLDYLMAFGEMLVNVDRLSDALYLVENLLPDFDGHGRLQALKGEILTLLNRYDEAADAFRFAAVQTPNDNKLLESQGLCLYRAGRYAECISVLNILAARQKEDFPVHSLRALAHSYMEIGEHATALVYWDDVTRNHPADYQARIMQARCDIQLGRLESAQRAAIKAVQLAPERPGTQLILGVVYWQRENWINARRALEAAVRVDPTDIEALCLLGQVCEAEGQPQRATGYYKRALEQQSDHELARMLLEELQALTLNDGTDTGPAGS